MAIMEKLNDNVVERFAGRYGEIRGPQDLKRWGDGWAFSPDDLE